MSKGVADGIAPARPSREASGTSASSQIAIGVIDAMLPVVGDSSSVAACGV
jgi:hypothetical protein